MNATVLWIVLICSALLVLGSLVFLALRVWHLVRTAKRIVRQTGTAAAPVTTGSARAAQQAAGLAAQNEKIGIKLARLRVSLARLNIVTAALHEGRAPLKRVCSYVSK
jgi:hypothetical protein